MSSLVYLVFVADLMAFKLSFSVSAMASRPIAWSGFLVLVSTQ
jgi:hypothetical protein